MAARKVETKLVQITSKTHPVIVAAVERIATRERRSVSQVLSMILEDKLIASGEVRPEQLVRT